LLLLASLCIFVFFPSVVADFESAIEAQETFKRELLAKRKLYLVLDLDQTIMHASPARDDELEVPQLSYFRYDECDGSKRRCL
jgi:hypothetical protein